MNILFNRPAASIIKLAASAAAISSAKKIYTDHKKLTAAKNINTNPTQNLALWCEDKNFMNLFEKNKFFVVKNEGSTNYARLVKPEEVGTILETYVIDKNTDSKKIETRRLLKEGDIILRNKVLVDANTFNQWAMSSEEFNKSYRSSNPLGHEDFASVAPLATIRSAAELTDEYIAIAEQSKGINVISDKEKARGIEFKTSWGKVFSLAKEDILINNDGKKNDCYGVTKAYYEKHYRKPEIFPSKT